MVKINLTALIVLVWALSACQPVDSVPPYPRSTVIEKAFFDWSSHVRQAEGSDNWPITWASDDHQYASWGDGGGFGGGELFGRVSLGVARIEGAADSYKAYNVWGGKDAENISQFEGKSYGIIAIEDELYQWVSPGSNEQAYIESRLYMSTDNAGTWHQADWSFDRQDAIVNPAFLQFGKGNQDARDDHVYIYASAVKDDASLRVQSPGEIILMRVPKSSLMTRQDYEFFSGMGKDMSPVWSKQFDQRKPVFEDKNGVGWNLSVSFNRGIGRYLLMTENTESFDANIGIFDAPEPWGPWTTVYYGKFGEDTDIESNSFYYNFSNKWLSDDGLKFTMIFTGIGENDSWNTVQGGFVLVSDAEMSAGKNK